MHRQSLQTKLTQHTPFDANETRMLADTIRFIDDHHDCFERSQQRGHITGSAWIIDLECKHTLLTHHRKLDRWFQLGGHSDGDPNTLAVARREGEEESGLKTLTTLSESIFDVDVHLIPARKDESAHYHYDVRFLFQADRHAPLVISSESKELAWVSLDEAQTLAPDESIYRMIKKTRQL